MFARPLKIKMDRNSNLLPDSRSWQPARSIFLQTRSFERQVAPGFVDIRRSCNVVAIPRNGVLLAITLPRHNGLAWVRHDM